MNQIHINIDLLKRRELEFAEFHYLPNQAQSACIVLNEVHGINDVQVLDRTRLLIEYDLAWISLNVIDDLLEELGYHLNNTLLIKLKRALYYYTENTQLANITQHKSSSTREVFINRYKSLEHGCRDGRPQHWRNYS